MSTSATKSTSTPGANKYAVTSSNWRRHAACTNADEDIFHPDKGEQTKIDQAKRICATCPAAAFCLVEGFATDRAVGLAAGTWGGASAPDREGIRKAGRRRRRRLVDEHIADMRDRGSTADWDTDRLLAGIAAAGDTEIWRPRETVGRAPGHDPTTPRMCANGHLVDGDNATKDGTTRSGAQKYRCRKCRLARDDRRRRKTVDGRPVCPQGHEVTGVNAKPNGADPDGTPRFACRVCYNDRRRRNRQQAAEQRDAA